MVEKSKQIQLFDSEKLKLINAETMKLYNKYKIDMSLRELSQNSMNAYENDLFGWFIYVYDNQKNVSVAELDEDDITEFLYFCKSGGNNSRRMKRRMSSISAFYKFLRRKRLIAENPMEFISRPKKDVDVLVQTFLTEAQVAQIKENLLDAVNKTEDLSIAKHHLAVTQRAYALFSLSTMARVNAVRNIRWEQIDFENRIVSDVLEKEGKNVTLYFSQDARETLECLRTYREGHSIDDGGYLFYTTVDGKVQPISVVTLNMWCKDIGSQIGAPTLHPHDWRHSNATLLKNRGMDLEDVSKLLNHADTSTTLKYYIKEDESKVAANKDKFEV